MSRQHPHRHFRGIAVGLVLTAILSPAPAFAHDIGVVVRVLDDEVEVEGYYEGDDPALDAKVIVTDDRGEVAAEGTLGLNGLWRVAKPRPGKYSVTVDAGPGHVAKRTFVVSGEASEPVGDSSAADETGDDRVVPSSFNTTWLRWTGLVVAALVVAILAGRLMIGRPR